MGARGLEAVSGVPAGKEVKNAIDFGGVADVADFHVKIDESVQFVHLQGESRSIGKMINKSVNLAEVDGIGKKSFHVCLGSEMKKVW
jgi:hypothetical protein